LGDDIEIAITHSKSQYSEEYHSFVNGQNTTQGGTHLGAFREAIVKTIKEFYNKPFEASDIRKSIVSAVLLLK
jgi:topoisomerase IV subunit B